MKKSMFLSTVAMIVVVVVALSTATFAWFSSFTSVSSNTNITVEAAGSGLLIRETNAGAAAWDSWSNILTPIDIQNATLSAPQTDIVQHTVADVNVLPVELKSEFYAAVALPADATNKLGGYQITKMTNNTSAGLTVGYKQFQVQKTGGAGDITCTVEVKANDGTTVVNQDILAAISTKVVIVATRSTNSTGDVVFGEKFNYQLHSEAAVTDEWDNEGLASEPDWGLVEGKLALQVKQWISGADTLKGRATALTGLTDAKPYDNINPALAGNKKSFTQKWSALGKAGASDILTLRAYIWNDGHMGDTYLASGKVQVSITFSVD